MNHDIRNIINRNSLLIGVIAVLVLLLLTSCRSSKSTSRNGSYAMAVERVERRLDSIRIVESTTQRSEHSGSEAERVYSRTTEYDTTGAIRSVQETWRDRQLFNVSTNERAGRIVSVTNSDEQVIQKDTAHAIITETSHIKSDSRPVQGIEWVWVILSVVLIAAVILYIIYNRIK